ncbi:uncharacterized protein PG986_010173 [Apiospora aurea]|uniref:Uncharacterized protein n=1 Tax=Apiospora aurea TaxID=335848 RepID=A0ABR1QAF3_9PEZI
MSNPQVKPEAPSNQQSGDIIKSEDYGQQDRSLDTIAQLTGSQSTGEAGCVAISIQEQDGQGHNLPHRATKHVGFDYETPIAAIMSEARSLGIVALRTDEIGRVMVDGRLVGIHHVFFSHEGNCLLFNRQQDFVVFDGFEVLARINDYGMKRVIFKMALHHIAQLVDCAHPHDLVLDINSPSLKYTCTEMRGGGWALRYFTVFDRLGT